LAFSPDGTLAAASKNGDLLRIPKGQLSAPKLIRGKGDNLQRIAWMSDGTTVAATSSGEIMLLDAKGDLSRHNLSVVKPYQTIGGLLSMPDRSDLIISISDGSLLRWQPANDRPADLLLAANDSADTLAAMSISLHPSGRWLAASRSDDQLRVYDVIGRAVSLTLPLPTRDTKTVAFSPDGALLAALTSDDRLLVWRFDAQKVSAEPLVNILAVPTVWRLKADQANMRQAQWIEWLDATHLGIATWSGAVLVLCLDPQIWRLRLKELRSDSATDVATTVRTRHFSKIQ
jgi:WD40 repeat protein